MRLIKAEEPDVRQLVLLVFKVLALQPSGKQTITESEGLLNLGTLLQDEDLKVRLSTAQMLLSLATWYFSKFDQFFRHKTKCQTYLPQPTSYSSFGSRHMYWAIQKELTHL